ncbi:hypothetical protein D9B84_14875 [Serratia marcescens]|uniref:DUF7210 family protein n=1 Tax=Serratia marcescens TaxID=615 RepID=UPI000F7E0BED|nr:hypothetical protein [Serratia marcescens]RTF18693.1 hypothetical protein D9B84_14875 [Serratia marcescens]
MKVKALVPILFGSRVVNDGELFETQELHGRELIKKGYAEQVSDDNPAEQAEQPEQPEQPEPVKKSKK